ncbi:L-seryl-tRNA(Sec) selenium transferase [Vulgatibacter sp.]|uniref:L-seryl-tRNA(Sec) selenium transferase n=1 Tax=Vulgatibacter sp. TaxID=1971226 RepID=UPI0035616DF5
MQKDERTSHHLLRALPAVDELLGRPAIRALLDGHPRAAVVRAARTAVDEARRRLLEGGADPSVSDEAIRAALALGQRRGLRPVINATGVVLHTNLGRAPLAEEAQAAVLEVARGYANLELDLDTGKRGSRYAPVAPLLCELAGAEAGLVVNNNAAAVLLVLSALAAGRECIVSRGELVEIGGGFRIPDVMRMAGVRLVEVGTTNKTRLQDYAEAIGPETALLLKIHKSNFALVGFTEEVSAAALSRLGRERGIPVYEDLGSGCLVPLEGAGLPHEPTVAEAVAAGADVITFSGDKLLGGPQAGLVVGRRELVERLERHPLNRALRIDKLTVAALEATLRMYRDGRAGEVPALRMLHASPESLRARAERLRSLLAERGVDAELVATSSQVGGGALPLAAPPSVALALAGPMEELHERLRRGEPAVVARIHEGRLLFDTRTVQDGELAPLAAAIAAAAGRA